MSLKRLVAPVLSTCLVAPFLVAASSAPAVAEPSWTRPDTVPSADYIHSAASNTAGGIVLDLSHVRHTSGEWRRLMDRPPVSGEQGNVVMDVAGNVTVVSTVGGSCPWENDFAPPPREDFVVRAAFRPVGGPWREQTIEGSWDGCYPAGVRVAVDERGTVTAVWPGDGLLHAAQRPLGGRWTTPVALGLVAPTYGEGGEFDVVADGDGRAVAAWKAPDGGVMTSVRSSVGRWSDPRGVETMTGQGVGHLQLVGGAPEPVLATWTATDSEAGAVIRAALRDGDGWLDARTIASPGTHQRIDGLDAVVQGGVPTVVWYQHNWNATRGSVRVVSRWGTRWADPELLGGRLPRETVPSLAANQLGILVAWTAGDETRAWTMVARRAVGAQTWARTRVGPPDEVEVDSEGRELWYSPYRAPRAVSYRPRMFTVIFTAARTMFSDFVDDTTPPRAGAKVPGDHFLGGPWMPVRWSGSDDLTGARYYDVRVRSAGRDGELSRWAIWQRRIQETRANFKVEPQRTYCFSARARDRAGNLGRWSRMRCVATPIDDRALAATSAWKRIDGTNSYRQTLTQTKRYGAQLNVSGVGARRISLMARTCPTCGVVRVWHGDRDLGRVDLASDAVRGSHVIRLRGYAKRSTASVVIRVVSRGKPVQIDGVIACR